MSPRTKNYQPTPLRKSDKLLRFNNLDAYPPLSKAKEQELATVIQDHISNPEHPARLKAIETLVLHNRKFAYKVAKQYLNQGLSYDDLCASADRGIVIAANNFKPLNYKFITYAVRKIKRCIQEDILEQTHTYHVPETKERHLGQLRSFIDALRHKLQRKPSEEEILNALEATQKEVGKLLLKPSSKFVLKVKKQLGHAPTQNEITAALRKTNLSRLREWMVLMRPTKSFDAPPRSENKSLTLYGVTTNYGTLRPDANLMHESKTIYLDQVLSRLKPKEELVIRLYCGFNIPKQLIKILNITVDETHSDKMTYEMIGGILKLTRERVRQIFEEAKNNLRQHHNLELLREALGETDRDP